MGGGSKSSSASTTKNSTRVQNLALDGVDGITVAGSEGVTINQTADGAFYVVNEAIQALEASQAKALTSLSENSAKTLDTVTSSTLQSFEKINQSNLSDNQQTVERVTQIGIAGLVVWGVTKLWGKA